VQAANVSGDDFAAAAQLPKDPFTRWCFQQVQTFNKDVDPEIFVSFMMSIESHAEVREYVEAYFGQGKPVEIFIKQFLHKREEHQAKAAAGNDHADFGGGYAPIRISPSSRQNPPSKKPAAANQQQSTGSGSGGAKKQGQGKRVFDSKMLGFTAVGDPNRLNAGEIERPS